MKISEAETKKLCMDLINADTEDDVIASLKAKGLWESADLWRYYGDRESNFNTTGNQQSRADAALVEKIINAVDARLLNECYVNRIDPEGSQAPQNIREAVSLFFEDSNPASPYSGRIKNWSDAKRRIVADGITVAATGAPAKEGKMCLSICDCGEGQTPNDMPSTLLSLDRGNKLKVPFVQGKFNMGGSGVLQFCGKHNLQLIVTKRNPKIGSRMPGDLSFSQWGFTVVRREAPDGSRRSSVYTYLAPLDAEQQPRLGSVLRFACDELPLFPNGRNAYSRMTNHGTLIKLYEYSTAGFYSTHILRKDGLLGRLDLLLPDIALPIRLHECRASYRGRESSFDTTLTGLKVRLEDDKGDNLEEGFPSTASISVQGEAMNATIYAFKKGRAATYRKSEGVIFLVNGQTHASLPADFFRRKQVGLSYIADSILIMIECSELSGRSREDLFMNSRDRLRNGDLKLAIEEELEELLKHHAGLRALKEKRRSEEVSAALEDAKPLEDVLKSMLDKYPTLAKLFLPGNQASNPFKSKLVSENEKPFEGKRFPTFFKFKNREYGSELRKDCAINMRARISFETDAENDYFRRDEEPGEFSLVVKHNGVVVKGINRNLNLQNGKATLSLQLPGECIEGDDLECVASVTDPARIDPFENRFQIRIVKPAEPRGSNGERAHPPSHESGHQRELPTGIKLPIPTRVHESDWQSHEPPFNEYSALRIKDAGSNGSNGDSQNTYDFFVNSDNIHLKRYLKETKNQNDKVVQLRFEIGCVLIGLALLYEESQRNKHDSVDSDIGHSDESLDHIEETVSKVSEAIAPFLLPMLDSLGSLDDEDVEAFDGVTEAS